MNEDMELTPDDRLSDLTAAYINLRGSMGSGGADAEKATALAQLSIAMSLLEREAYAEGEYEEGEDEEDEDEEEL